MSLEEHDASWQKVEMNFIYLFGGRWALYFFIGAPQYPFRDVEGGAVLVNIHQLGSEVCIRRGCRDVQDQRYGSGHLHILIQGWGCVHKHITSALDLILTGDASGWPDHRSASRGHWMQRIVCIRIS